MTFEASPRNLAPSAESLAQKARDNVIAKIAQGDLPTYGAKDMIETPVSHTGVIEPPAEWAHLLAMLADNNVHETLLAHRLDIALATACFGKRHLWEDLGMQGREDVSAILKHYYPALHAANTHNIRWKKWLFLKLGEKLGSPGLRPPHCRSCEQFEQCFPEG